MTQVIDFIGGEYRNRTGVHGFAIRCVTTPPTRHPWCKTGAGSGPVTSGKLIAGFAGVVQTACAGVCDKNFAAPETVSGAWSGGSTGLGYCISASGQPSAALLALSASGIYGKTSATGF